MDFLSPWLLGCLGMCFGSKKVRKLSAVISLSDGNKYEADKGDIHSKEEALSVSREEVENNFKSYGLLDENVEFLVGWFKDTLPKAPINKIAVLRFLIGLANLKLKLVPIIIIR